MPKGYNTNLASEFLVLSNLYRLGYDASLTLGNKKSVDIVVVFEEGRSITIDVKAVAGKDDWLLGDGLFRNALNHFFVLMSFEKRFEAIDQIPRSWVFPANDLSPLIKVAGNQKTKYVTRTAVFGVSDRFENAWHLLNEAPAAQGQS